jgi:hypothetical protein
MKKGTIVKHFVCDIGEIQESVFRFWVFFFKISLPLSPLVLVMSLGRLGVSLMTIRLSLYWVKSFCVGSSIALNFPGSSFGGICGSNSS